MAQRPTIDDFNEAEEAIAAASKLEMTGYWKDATELYEGVAEKWPDHKRYADNCVKAIAHKRGMARWEPDDESRPFSTGEWFVTLLVLAIPVVNIIMYLVWAFGDCGNVNRKNFCKASLIWSLLLLAFVLIASSISDPFSDPHSAPFRP